jgi:protein involved in ribonucleotide reduction
MQAVASLPRVVYFSSVTENTHRFVEKLGLPAERIPLLGSDQLLQVAYPYALIVPTYGAGIARGAVPKQVVRFLNDEQNRSYCYGVIAAGNTNFGAGYGIAGRVIGEKLSVPVLYTFELLGLPQDVIAVREGLIAHAESLISRRSGL